MNAEDPEAMDEPPDTVMPEHYIPAGVLAKSTNRYPGSEIALLEKHEWICTRSLGDSNNVQVFVLPQQKSISRPNKGGVSETAIESALKLVMSMIDSSPEAWNGSVDAHASLLANTQRDAEEESLYYIYNTLQDPEPNLDQVTDPFSQAAMEELLDDSVRGLKTTLYPYQRKSAAAMVQREAQPALMLDPRFQPWQGPTGLEFYYDKVNGSILREKIYYPEACGGGYSYLWS
jgi:hypothetical protein